MAVPDSEAGSGNGPVAGWQAGTGQVVVLLHGGPRLSECTEGFLPELVDRDTVVRFHPATESPAPT
ncbi:MAG: hypothetical protein HKL89_08000 [Candidatus Dormibacteraeota bacterium]|nr:hypothetical protein [Candidatus Dormibacteraeota bacterium]